MPVEQAAPQGEGEPGPLGVGLGLGVAMVQAAADKGVRNEWH